MMEIFRFPPQSRVMKNRSGKDSAGSNVSKKSVRRGKCRTRRGFPVRGTGQEGWQNFRSKSVLESGAENK
jgi:hypothetical protein